MILRFLFHPARTQNCGFFSRHMDKEAITRKLNDALLTEKESVELGGVKGWRTLTDPFSEGAAAEEFFELHEVHKL